jgi:hypothetical protein
MVKSSCFDLPMAEQQQKRSQTPNWHTKASAGLILFIRSFNPWERTRGGLNPAKTGGKVKDDKF